MATSSPSHRTIKGILKKTGRANGTVLIAEDSGTPGSSAGIGSGEEFSKKSQKWDERSILVTYHPTHKDYELMNIEEPNTPYHLVNEDTEDESTSDSKNPKTIVPEFLAQRLAIAQGTEPKGREPKCPVCWGEPGEEEDPRWKFELKRKLHYEALNIKFAQQLISREFLADADYTNVEYTAMEYEAPQ